MVGPPNDKQDKADRFLPWVKRRDNRGRCAMLLVALATLLALGPYFPDSDESSVVLNVLLSLTALAGIYAVSTGWHMAIATGVLAVPLLVDRWVPYSSDLVSQVSPLAGVVFYLFTSVTVLGHVLRGRTVTTDKLYGAVAVYLLVGLTFAFAYVFLERIAPGSLVASSGEPVTSFFDVLYFSYVTLTTLGYGDIAPRTDEARTLATFEAVTGVMYSAVLIARLVGAAARTENPPVENAG